MNINTSGMEVRQGQLPVEEVQALLQEAVSTQKPPARDTGQQNEEDQRSLAAVSAADRQSALDAANKLEKHLEANDTSLKIRLLDNSQSGVQVEIVDTSNNKVLRKIPQDELIKLSASIKKMTGVFVNQAT